MRGSLLYSRLGDKGTGIQIMASCEVGGILFASAVALKARLFAETGSCERETPSASCLSHKASVAYF